MTNTNGEPFILVVDDHETNIELMTRMLRRTNFNVMSAYDGEEACRILEEHTPLLILSDIMMPRMDGYQLLQHVRGHARLEQIPFIFVSAKSNQEYLERGLAMGATEYLAKPFRPQELIETVQRHAAAMF